MRIKIYIIFIFLFNLCSGLYCQGLKIIRTDVESARESFVTATYKFGIDIISENITNCNTVAFELHFNHSEYIKLSGWYALELGDNSTSVVISTENDYTDEGIVSVGVFSGKDLTEANNINPSIIHLDFVVTQSAIHGDILTFTFINAFAVVNKNGAGEKLSLSGGPFSYDVHSFVNVWPGDADNDGYVNTNDIAQIGLYHGFGVRTKTLRTFKREQPSVLWYGQRALAWDSSTVTFADCDGDGAITMKDILVVALNYDSLHYKPFKEKEKIQGLEVKAEFNKRLSDESSSECIIDFGVFTPSKGIYYKTLRTERSISIPIFISSNEPFIAAATKLNISNIIDKYKITGIERGEIFDEKKSFLIYHLDKSMKTIDIATGQIGSDAGRIYSGVLINIIAEPLDDEFTDEDIYSDNVDNVVKAEVEEITAIDKNGKIFILNAVSGVPEQSGIFEVNIWNRGDYLLLDITKFITGDLRLELYNIMGRNLLINKNINTGSNIPIIDISQIPQGVYFLKLDVEGKHYIRSFSVLRQ